MRDFKPMHGLVYICLENEKKKIAKEKNVRIWNRSFASLYIFKCLSQNCGDWLLLAFRMQTAMERPNRHSDCLLKMNEWKQKMCDKMGWILNASPSQLDRTNPEQFDIILNHFSPSLILCLQMDHIIFEARMHKVFCIFFFPFVLCLSFFCTKFSRNNAGGVQFTFFPWALITYLLIFVIAMELTELICMYVYCWAGRSSILFQFSVTFLYLSFGRRTVEEFRCQKIWNSNKLQPCQLQCCNVFQPSYQQTKNSLFDFVCYYYCCNFIFLPLNSFFVQHSGQTKHFNKMWKSVGNVKNLNNKSLKKKWFKWFFIVWENAVLQYAMQSSQLL